MTRFILILIASVIMSCGGGHLNRGTNAPPQVLALETQNPAVPEVLKPLPTQPPEILAKNIVGPSDEQRRTLRIPPGFPFECSPDPATPINKLSIHQVVVLVTTDDTKKGLVAKVYIMPNKGKLVEVSDAKSIIYNENGTVIVLFEKGPLKAIVFSTKNNFRIGQGYANAKEFIYFPRHQTEQNRKGDKAYLLFKSEYYCGPRWSPKRLRHFLHFDGIMAVHVLIEDRLPPPV